MPTARCAYCPVGLRQPVSGCAGIAADGVWPLVDESCRSNLCLQSANLSKNNIIGWIVSENVSVFGAFAAKMAEETTK